MDTIKLSKIFNTLNTANIWLNGAMCAVFSKHSTNKYEHLMNRFSLHGINLTISTTDFIILMKEFLEYCGRQDLIPDICTNTSITHDEIISLIRGAPSYEYFCRR